MFESLGELFAAPVRFFFWGTARIVLPLVSLGRLRVQARPRDAEARRSEAALPPFHRLPSGQVAVGSDSAALLGALMWGTLAVVSTLNFNY
jgi:hypothetical protein